MSFSAKASWWRRKRTQAAIAKRVAEEGADRDGCGGGASEPFEEGGAEATRHATRGARGAATRGGDGGGRGIDGAGGCGDVGAIQAHAPPQQRKISHFFARTAPASHGSVHGTPHGTPHGALHGSVHGTPHGAPHGSVHGTSHGAPHGSVHGTSHGTPHNAPRACIDDVSGGGSSHASGARVRGNGDGAKRRRVDVAPARADGGAGAVSAGGVDDVNGGDAIEILDTPPDHDEGMRVSCREPACSPDKDKEKGNIKDKDKIRSVGGGVPSRNPARAAEARNRLLGALREHTDTAGGDVHGAAANGLDGGGVGVGVGVGIGIGISVGGVASSASGAQSPPPGARRGSGRFDDPFVTEPEAAAGGGRGGRSARGGGSGLAAAVKLTPLEQQVVELHRANPGVDARVWDKT
eukprot:37901-Chlamydomonas_euryale.AAC.4